MCEPTQTLDEKLKKSQIHLRKSIVIYVSAKAFTTAENMALYVTGPASLWSEAPGCRLDSEHHGKLCLQFADGYASLREDRLMIGRINDWDVKRIICPN